MSPVFQQTFYGALGDFSSRSTYPRGNTLSGPRSLVTSRSLVWFRVLKVIRNTINTDKDGILSTRVVQYAMIFLAVQAQSEERRKHDQTKKNKTTMTETIKMTNDKNILRTPWKSNHANTATTNLTGSWYLISSFTPGLHKDTSELQIRDTEPAAFTSLLEYIYLPQVQAIYLRKS